MNRINEYIQYHVDSSRALDIDPQVEAIHYLCRRFELNVEQRCWLCFLFSTNYCVATTYYIYNEFPDFATVDEGRLQRWWALNRPKLVFQTDRAWIRSRNQFCDVFRSYRNLIKQLDPCGMSQYKVLKTILSGGTPEENYERLLERFKIHLFGRFTMFLYSELLCNIVGLNIGVEFRLEEAESSRNGLVFALGLEWSSAYTGRTGKRLPERTLIALNSWLKYIADCIARLPINPRHKTLWSIETTLCAYKKHKLNNRRWVGYYIERMRREIFKLESQTSKQAGGGVSWLPLWQFRAETYNKKFLKEWQ